jgi:monoamine oxidase
MSQVSISSGAPRLDPTDVLPHRQSPTGISVLIVGAGVGGIMSALECWRKGHTVRILERSLSAPETG